MNGYKPIEREVKPRFKVGDEVILTNDFGEEKLVKVTKVEEYNSKAYMYWIGETWFGDGQNARLVQTEQREIEEIIGEAYVSYETSLLLAKKGFDEETLWYYDSKGVCEPHSAWVDAKPNEYSPMPTLQMACAWLRRKGYHIAVLYRCKYKSWERIIQSSTGVEWSIGGFSRHDEAVEEALTYALEELI